MFRITIALVLAVTSNASALANPLHDAAREGDVGKVRSLIDNGAKFEISGDTGETPLTIAILSARSAVVELLIEKGADIRMRNSGGFTALHAAAYVGDVSAATELLRQGVNIDDQENKAGVTPLSVSAEEGHVGVTRILIEQGANLEAGERNGFTPLSRALWRDQQEVVSLLQRAGAECQPGDILGTAAHAQCAAGAR